MTDNSIHKRLRPVLGAIGRVTGYSGYFVNNLPSPYRGWIDFTDEGMYCTIFDLKNKSGVGLRDQFLESSDDEKNYDFEPTSTFRTRGRLIGKGQANDLEWYVLQT